MQEKVRSLIRYQGRFKALVNALQEWEKGTTSSRCSQLASLEEVRRRMAGFESFSSDLAAIRPLVEREILRLEPIVASEQALLAGQVVSALHAKGFRVTGNLPVLHCRCFFLEFIRMPAPQIVVWFGPRMEELARCEPNPQQCVETVLALMEELFPESLDTKELLVALLAAYRAGIARGGLSMGGRLPLTQLMVEYNLGLQSEKFWADPACRHYQGLSRAQFAARLSQLTSRTMGEYELRLDVATMSQSKKDADHLWVPRKDLSDGVLLATASVVRQA